MDYKSLLKDMKASIGTEDPIKFFDKMVDVFAILLARIDELEKSAKQSRLQSALAIQWEPKLASSMLSNMIDKLREDKETYCEEISQLKRAFVEGKVTQNYYDFCNFWQEVLGWHPFLDYK